MRPHRTSTRRNVFAPFGTYTQSRSWRCRMADAGTHPAACFSEPWKVAWTNMPRSISPGFSTSIRTLAVRMLGSRIAPILLMRPLSTTFG